MPTPCCMWFVILWVKMQIIRSVANNELSIQIQEQYNDQRSIIHGSELRLNANLKKHWSLFPTLNITTNTNSNHQ